ARRATSRRSTSPKPSPPSFSARHANAAALRTRWKLGLRPANTHSHKSRARKGSPLPTLHLRRFEPRGQLAIPTLQSLSDSKFLRESKITKISKPDRDALLSLAHRVFCRVFRRRKANENTAASHAREQMQVPCV